MSAAVPEALSVFQSQATWFADTAFESRAVADYQIFGLRRYKVPLWDIHDRTRRFKMKNPVEVDLRFEDGWFFAENEKLTMVGVGRTAEDAIMEFSQHIIHFHLFYRSLSWDQVTGEAVRLKNVFENLLEEVA